MILNTADLSLFVSFRIITAFRDPTDSATTSKYKWERAKLAQTVHFIECPLPYAAGSGRRKAEKGARRQLYRLQIVTQSRTKKEESKSSFP